MVQKCLFGSSAVRVSKTVPIAYARTQMGESKIRAQNNPGTVTWVLAKLEMPIVIVSRADVDKVCFTDHISKYNTHRCSCLYQVAHS